MRSHPVPRVLVVASLLLAVTACSDAPDPTAPAPALDDPAVRPATLPASGSDPVALARGVRGFGGFFLDRDGAPTIYLRDAAERGAAEVALAPFLAERGKSGSDLRVLPAAFEYSHLESWFEKASPEALAVPGAVYADLDEGSNRLRIGVAGGGAVGAVRRALAGLRIPDAALVVEEVAPIRAVATLEERLRPVQGGLQINFILGICSLGFNAVHVQSGQLSFLTASHCTWTRGGTEGTIYYQHTWFDLTGSDNTIGTEVADPLFFSSPRRRKAICPPNRVCRYSDAARAAYGIDPSDVALGIIAKTTGENALSTVIDGSFTINPQVPEHAGDRFTIGSTTHKVGRTTGWTSAAVGTTCANVNVDGTPITMLCQTLVGAGTANGPVLVGPGDSGSPVFLLSAGGATAAGILWGGNAEGTLFAFSPLANVQRELGDLRVIPAP